MTGAEERLIRVQHLAAAIGVSALAGALGAVWRLPELHAPAYLFGLVCWLNLSLGAWALALVHDLVGGAWGDAVRPVLRAAARVLPALALLFVPVLVWRQAIYPWAGDEGPPAHLQGWMRPGFFVARSVAYFGCWIFLSRFLGRVPSRRPGLSAGALALYLFTTFFASVDWVMSIEPRWASSIYGLLFVGDQAVSALALATALLALAAPGATRQVRNDLGNLLLTAVLLWTYLSFSQYLIIWSENLPRETPWVARRSLGGWRTVAQVLIGLHFVVPLLLLLFRRVKTDRRWLAGIAIGLLALRLVDVWWRILPPFEPDGPALRISTVAAPLGIGGLWTAFFLAAYRREASRGKEALHA